MPLRTNIVIIGTLWMFAVFGVDAHWGSSLQPAVRRSRRGYFDEEPVAELVRDLIYVPGFPSSLMRPQGPFSDARGEVPWQPRFEVSEGEDGTVHLTMDVPGVTSRELNIELENDHVLRINGVRTRHQNGRISESKFNHSIRLKDTVDPDRMEANLSSGVLTITVPEKPTKIRKLTLSTDERSILDPPLTQENIKNPDII